MSKKYSYQYKKVHGILFDKWLVKLEKRAFGWTYCSTTEDYTGTDQVETHIDLDSGTGYSTRTPITEKNLNFVRVRPYTNNFLFKLTEFLSNVVSCIRRFAMAILIPVIIAMLVFFILTLTACNDPNAKDSLEELLKITAIVYLGGLFAPSGILAFLGFIFRLVFGIDKKLISDLEANGYTDD